MKSAEHRDAMVASVQKAYADYPRFSDIPKYDGDAWAYSIQIEDPTDNTSYVGALYELFNTDPEIEIVGRSANKLIGK